MGISIRHYIVHDDGALRRVSRRIVDGLSIGTDAIVEYAGTRQKVAEVLIENDGRRPVRILDITGSFWEFDAEGKIDEALLESAGEWMNYAFSTYSRNNKSAMVVDLVPELKKKDLHNRHRWTVTKEEFDRISADLWPGIHGTAPDVTTVKGKAPKKPPLTYQARHALAEIGGKVGMIDYELEKLTEPGLKGLEFEARRTADHEQSGLWSGVAEQAKYRREIRAAYRTGKGEWYAVIEAFQPEEPGVMKSVHIAFERCKSQAKAIEAAKRLMAEKAHWVGAETRIDVSICAALEWQPEQD